MLSRLKQYPCSYFHKLNLPWHRWKYAAARAQIDPLLAKLCIFGIRYGWHAGIIASADPISAQSNHPIPDSVKPKVIEDILHGLDAGFILGPFSPNNPWSKETIISPLGTVTKKSADSSTIKYRVIQDLSHGKRINRSVNVFIPNYATLVHYITLKQIVSMIHRLGPGAMIWVADMAEAYRRVLLHHSFHKYLGFRWENMIFRYACLPFGLSSSPQIYSAFAECLRQIVLFSHPRLFFVNGFPVIRNYLDDFFAAHPNPASAWAQYRLFRQWLLYLGIPTQDWKCCSPNVQAIILGFLYNTVNQTVSIPKAKLQQILESIRSLLSKTRRVSRRELAVITGKLNWCCQIIFGAHSMIRSLEFVIDSHYPWDRKVLRLNSQVKADLKWWINILQSPFTSISFDWIIKNPATADIHVWSDASGSHALGFGAYSSLGHFFQIKWNAVPLPSNMNWNDIHFPEFLALTVAAIVWAPQFTGKAVHFHCDNSSVVSMVVKRSTPKYRPDLLRLARWLTQVALFFKFYFWTQHIPGALNIEADNLSRFKPNPFKRFSIPNIYESIDQFSKPFFNLNPNYSDSFIWKQEKIDKLVAKCIWQDPTTALKLPSF